MAWITPDDVIAAYPEADVTPGFIAHIQALAEVCTGVQTEPISSGLKATFVDVVYRKHLAGTTNPEGINMEVLGPYTRQHTAAPGLGLTRTDCRALKKAVGKSTVGVLSVGGGPLETPPIHPDDGESIEEIFG